VTTWTCDIWWAEPVLVRDWHVDLLSDAERGRREALLREADRARFTVGAALLRLVAAAHTGRPAAEVVVNRRCATCDRPHGRPRIAGSDVHVSVSHSGERVAVAVTRAGPLGVDVEEIREVDLDKVAPIVLAPDETGRVSSASDFYAYWTRKEAVVKATGDGLAMPLQQVLVTPPDAAPELIAYAGWAMVAQVRDLAPGAGYAGALAVLTPQPLEVREHPASALLADAVHRAVDLERG
jgi:4'-phosphopantetheinyl transferase